MAAYEFPMKIPAQDAAAVRWLDKPVRSSTLLDDCEDPSTWQHVEQGSMSFTKSRCRTGTQSVRLTSPTLSDKSYQNEGPGRPHGRSAVRRVVHGEDWRGYNRISFWVYPTLPGFRVISMSVILYNDGETQVPESYLREGIHYFLLAPDRWNRVVWEIPHLARDRVTGLEFVYRLQGSDAGATRTVVYDIDQIELQTVDADPYEGWAVRDGAIAYSHSGYTPGADKRAILADPQVTKFRLLEANTGRVAYEGTARPEDTPVGTFATLDFSDWTTEGRYVLEAGGARTRPFPIGARIWTLSIWKTLNFFYCERCGTEVPGIHAACHRDWLTRHGELALPANGGWHDAGDLSQGLVNTAEAVYAMLALAERLRETDSALSARMTEEARWGLDWVLKTRFGDGYRTTWATMDLWTDGILGTIDDEAHDARNLPFENLVAAATEARAARAFRDADPILAAHCLQAAEEDYRFAREAVREWDLPHASQAVLAAVELVKAGAADAQSYISEAADLARTIVACQQQAWTAWDVPMRGFYYKSPERKEILHYLHRGHEQAPTVALAVLCELLPTHEAWTEWYAAVCFHTEYLQQAAALSSPYGMLAAGIYREDAVSDPAYQAQVRNGVPLGQGHYLRRFPVWYAFRGNCGTVLSQTKALTAGAALRRSRPLEALARLQLEWVVGRNPFAQSLMTGEGHDFAPQYTAMSGDMTGSLPVGIATKENRDLPYWPMQNCYNYKEVWVHPSSRWLWLMEELHTDMDMASADGRLTYESRDGGNGLLRFGGTLAPGEQARLRTRGLTAAPSEDQTLTWATSQAGPAGVAVLEIVRADGSIRARYDAMIG